MISSDLGGGYIKDVSYFKIKSAGDSTIEVPKFVMDKIKLYTK